MKSTFGLRSSALAKLGYGIATVLWLASFLLPAAEINGSTELVGYRVFRIGIDAISAGMFGWLANPLMIVAMFLGLKQRLTAAVALSGLAVLFSLLSFYAPAIARAQGLPIEDVDFKAGFFLWLAACSLIFVTSLYAFVISRRQSKASS